jgi:peptidoglycan LD-endopeptidase CwlK
MLGQVKATHNYRVAFDFVPIVKGKANWSDPGLFEMCGSIAESCGLEWAGRWKRFKELAHCQFTGGMTISDFKKGKTL